VSPQAFPLWTWLLTLAAFLYVFGVLLRRVEVFEKQGRNF